MSTEILLTIDIAIISILLLVIMFFVIIANRNEKRIKTTETPKSNTSKQPTLDVSYDQVVKIIDDLVKFNVASTIILHGLHDKTSEELSISMDRHIVDISESIYINMGEPLKNSLKQYMSEDYIKLYLIGTVRLVLIARLSNIVE